MRKRFLALLLGLLLLAGCAAPGGKQNSHLAEHPLPGSSTDSSGDTDPAGQPSLPVGSDVPAPPDIDEPAWPRAGDTLLTMTTADMGQGELILVNNQNFYEMPEDMSEQLITIAKGKSKSYQLKDYTGAVLPATIEHLNEMIDAFVAQGGPTDIMVVSGWRSYETQQHLFDNSVARNGLEHANRFVAKPKGSEHHTGYAIDLWSVNRSEYLDYVDDYKWITDHCNDYGFILRYAKEKEPVTGIGEETWHYRYLGLPHSWIVTEHGFCYEEYIDFLRDYPYTGEHLLYDGPNGQQYEIYFVDGLEVPVPENGDYTVSGNNVDGFIVTVTK